MHTMTAFIVVILITALAAARLARIITTDRIGHKPRAAALKKYGPNHWLPYLLHCPYCVTIWTAAALTPAAWFLTNAPNHLGITSWFGLPATTLAVAYLAAIVTTRETNEG